MPAASPSPRPALVPPLTRQGILAPAAPHISIHADLLVVLAMAMLLAQFWMLRSPMLRSQVLTFATQSTMLAAAMVVVGATSNIGALYGLAALTILLKVAIVPPVIHRLTRARWVDVAHSIRLRPASAMLAGIVVAGVGFALSASFHLARTAAGNGALDAAMALLLLAFLVTLLRTDVSSQAIGFLSLDNAASLASLVLASSVPLLVELAFLLDVLVVIATFGILIRVHHVANDTLSTDVLRRLRG